MNRFDSSMQGLINSFSHNRILIARMARREVAARYRGSIIGLAWSFVNPVLLLLVYTFIFTVVFKARWGGGQFNAVNDGSFAIMIFAGMIVHALFSECFIRSPILITGNANFVKRVVFPLEVLSWVAIGASTFHAGVSLLVLMAGELLLTGHIPITAVLVPIVYLPLMILTLGLSWFFSASGVYFRDLSQVSGFISTVLLFLSPVFYPLSSIPELYRWAFYLNPLTFIIESSRDLLLFGRLPSATELGMYYAVSLGVAWSGFAWFQKTRSGFADVI
jgi:lipopolysaccharide transport system permease protein